MHPALPLLLTAMPAPSPLLLRCASPLQGLHLLALRLRAATEAAADAGARRRTSIAAGSRRVTSMHNRRTTGQHQAVRRMSAAGLVERRASIQLLPAPGGGAWGVGLIALLRACMLWGGQAQLQATPAPVHQQSLC